MRVAITGSTGLIGSALKPHLESLGHEVIRVVRSNPTGTDIVWSPAESRIDTHALDGVNAVVHLAGAGIGDKRWTDDYKRELTESRTKGTTLISEAIAAADNGPTVFLSGSAIGIYGARGDEELDEASRPGDGFLADLCVKWEQATALAAAAGVRVVHLRTGIVLSAKGGALKKQLPLFKFGLGGKMGNGGQWQSWISIDDEVAAIAHLLTTTTSGAVNLTAPNPVTNLEFTKALGEVLHRPTFVPIPKFGPKLLLGGELADNLLFSGQKVLPRILEADEGFTFAHPDLATALGALLDS
ncbi:MAG TPA: TIGR01777 family oxidoreductase [Ilumatobacteraceae bacterium]|nr:TIGR01777 family oxidoreductase [Ilumatobacteraceae bacterium]